MTTKPATPLGLRQPWQWVQPATDADLVARLIEAREYAVHERERENLCSVAAGRIGALYVERGELVAALRSARDMAAAGAPKDAEGFYQDDAAQLAKFDALLAKLEEVA